mmetsp:Transcript_52866/g.141247  ORF Transcript_52866/g.141247 Transcript_52866/m.141247 type:complete len:219 (-) Transcript_52866:109-765(-)
MQYAGNVEFRRMRSGSCTLDSRVHVVRHQNLLWRTAACLRQKSVDVLHPSLRGLVTDTAQFSGTRRAPHCLSKSQCSSKERANRIQRSVSCSWWETDATSRVVPQRSTRPRKSCRAWLRPQVSFELEPPVEVPTIVSLGQQHRVPDRSKRNRARAREVCAKLEPQARAQETASEEWNRTPRPDAVTSCFDAFLLFFVQPERYHVEDGWDLWSHAPLMV